MKKRELKPKKTSTTFVPWKITEVYHTEVEYFNEAELKRMAENFSNSGKLLLVPYTKDFGIITRF